MTDKKDPIIGVTCKNFHTTYFDMRKVCKGEDAYRTLEQVAIGDEQIFYFQCDQCGEKTKVAINCKDYI